MLFDKKISLVIPAHNEEGGLAHLLKDIPPYVDEVVVVDNNSTDNTGQVARSFNCRVVEEKKQGYGIALKSGFQAAEGEIIITMDADGTCLFEHYPRLIKHMVDNGVDFVTARRIPDRFRTFTSLLRFMGDMFLDVTCWIFFRFWIYDSQSGVWAFKRDILSRINLDSDGWALSEEIKIETFTHPELKAAELPILYINIRLGDSKLRMWRDGFANLCYIVKKWKKKKIANQVSPSSR